MFLRQLTIRGFKSFADKTVLEFAPGISAVVGPNGSGKSNLVDAIAWVLGEQGPRALRGSQMADVIFAGSPGRPALGMAEVTLVIDNSEGLIPVQLSEIEVARVVYRSGESQYLIGGRPVRLMDLQELLSDTGIGRALHTVVGQGQLEDVLLARPEDRRQFIEEAAGIAKHRRRKERAQRKLAALEQDLLRLQDVMAELRRQLKPLKQQAEVARRHQAFTDEASSLASRLAAARLRELYRERDRRRSGWEQGRARGGEAEERLRSLDEEIAALGELVAAGERGLAEAEAAEAAALRARSAAEASLREAVRAEGEARERVAAESGRSGRLLALEEEAERAAHAVEVTRRALERREAELEEAERSHRAAGEERRRAEEERRAVQEAGAMRRGEVEALRRSLESSEAERERLSAAALDLDRREAEAVAAREAVESEVERLDAEETPLAGRQASLEAERDRVAMEVAELEERERELEARYEALEARRAALASTPGRRFLASRGGRALGLLGGLVRVRDGMERAVAAALGPYADAVVYEDQADAVADAGEAGGAILAVAGERSGGLLLPGERSLASVVEADPRARGLVAWLLRDVYLADDPQEALGKHRRHPGASFVSPDGVLVGPAIVRTAPTRMEEEMAAGREADRTGRELAHVRGGLEGSRRKIERVEAELAELGDRLSRADGLITAAADRMAALGAELAAAEREREMLSERSARVEEALRSAREALARIPPAEPDAAALPPPPEPPIALRVEVEALRRERGRLGSGLARIQEELLRIRSDDPDALGSLAAGAAEARASAESALAEAEARAAETAARREEAARSVADVRASEGAANEAWRAAAASLQRFRDEHEEEDQVRRDLERRIAEGERVLADGHGRDPGEAVAVLGEDDTVESLQRRSDLVARRLALLGRVNLVAGEELHQLQERHDFLQREIDDVRAARRDLMEVVREVDRKVVEIFEAAFRDVAAQFAELFGTVFPGGEGKLSLTDPTDLLGTGIEIEARPGRKRVKRLSLLSGGERALTALAFLFAIFRARPSPFYLLDEVEAALDDVNLHRFLDLVRDFARSSQVLLVTHQKRTMEAADILYGVSMNGDGASTVVCQRIAEAVPQLAEH